MDSGDTEFALVSLECWSHVTNMNSSISLSFHERLMLIVHVRFGGD